MIKPISSQFVPPDDTDPGSVWAKSRSGGLLKSMSHLNVLPSIDVALFWPSIGRPGS